jgi:hypothetical protein
VRIKAFFGTVGRIFDRLLQWLASKTKMPDEPAVGKPQPGSASYGMSLSDITFNPLIFKIIAAFLTAAVIVVLITCLIKSRNKKFKLSPDSHINGSGSERKRIKGGFSVWFMQYWCRLKFETAYILNKTHLMVF